MPLLLSSFRHYIGVAAILLLAYFLFGPMIVRYEDAMTAKGQGPQVVLAQPTPGGAASAVASVADAAKETALAAAIEHQAIQLSAAQQTIASMAQHMGANATFASGIAGGITRPAPQRQVITVGTSAHFAPSPAPDDSQIVADVKKAMKETPLKVDTNVKVSWENKPLSPFFAAYNMDGATGVGYTFRKAPFLNADALLVAKSQGGTEVGLGIDHIIKGTSASIGLDATYSPQTRKVVPGIFAGIRW